MVSRFLISIVIMTVAMAAIILPRGALADEMQGNTVYVDAVYGSDSLGKVYNESSPFATLNGAVAGITAQIAATLTTPVKISMRPGSYAGGTLQKNMFLKGEGQATVLTSTLTITGASQVSDIAFVLTNKNALVVNTGDNTVLVDINNVFMTVTYSATMASYAIINNTAGYTTFRNGNILATVKGGVVTKASFMYINAGSELDVTDCQVSVAIKVSAVQVALYEARGIDGFQTSDQTNLKVDGGFSKIALSNKTSGEVYMLLSSHANTRFDYVILNMNGPFGAFCNCTGDNTVKWGLSSMNYKNFLQFYSCIGYEDSYGQSPDVRFIGDGLVDNTFPEQNGTFSRYDVSITDVQGVITAGALVAGVRASNAAIDSFTDRDATLIVSYPGAWINMSSPNQIAPNAESTSGRIACVKNVATDSITLHGAIFGGDQIVDSGSAAILIATEDEWYVMLSGHVVTPAPSAEPSPSPSPSKGARLPSPSASPKIAPSPKENPNGAKDTSSANRMASSFLFALF